MQITHPRGASAMLQVLEAARQEVMFRDGSRIELRRVQSITAPAPDPLLRAVFQGRECLLFDLRQIAAADFESDFKRLELRDHPGLIFFSLRQAYRTAAAALQAIQAQALTRTELLASTQEAA